MNMRQKIWRRRRPAILAVILALSIIPAGCRKKTAVAAPPQINPEAADHLAKGDASMREAHLYGWRQAEKHYQAACLISDSADARKKLLKAQFLSLVRQIDEDIPSPTADEVIKRLCAEDTLLCAIAEWYGGGKTGPLNFKPPIFKGEDPALESYLNLLLFNAVPGKDVFHQLENIESSQTSPLFLYLNPGRLPASDPAQIEKNYPFFAEAFVYSAESLYVRKKYRGARASFQKAVEMIPEYTKALVGLGNIYYYVLEDYEQGLRYYETALERDPSYPAALFGKSLVLNQTGKYQESNEILDFLLACNLERQGWIDGVPYPQYYRGQANYLKAYNYYLMKNTVKAREFIDAAKKFLPDSEEIHYLSGLLFYGLKELEPARDDFLRVGQGGSMNSCDAQLHLGFIYQQLSEKTAGRSESILISGTPGKTDESVEKKSVEHFVGAGKCLESIIVSLSYQLRNMVMDLEPEEQNALRQKMEKKLQDLRRSSISTIEKIKGEVLKSSIAEKTVYSKYLDGTLARLREK